MKNNTGIIIGGLLIAVSIVIGGIIMQPEHVSPNVGNSLTNTISVAGEGKVTVSPDTLVLNVTVSELADTTAVAQQTTDEKVEQIRNVLEENDIDPENVKSENFNMYPEYDYRGEEGRELLGYRANHTLRVEITDENYANIGGTIINQISKIGGVQVNNISFTLEDKETAMQDARAEAFANAKEKAEQLADLAGVRLDKPFMITDQEVSYPGPIYPMMELGRGGAVSEDAAANTSLSAGQMEVTLRLQVIYEID